MVIRVRTTFGDYPVRIDYVVSLRGDLIPIDEVSEIILEGDDFCIDINREEEEIRITTQ